MVKPSHTKKRSNQRTSSKRTKKASQKGGGYIFQNGKWVKEKTQATIKDVKNLIEKKNTLEKKKEKRTNKNENDWTNKNENDLQKIRNELRNMGQISTHEKIAQRITLPNYTNKKSMKYSPTKPKHISNKQYKANTYMRGIVERENAIRQKKFKKATNKRLRTTYNQTPKLHRYHNHPNNHPNNNTKHNNEPAPEMWKGFNENKMHTMRSFYKNLDRGYIGSESKNNLKMQGEYYKRHNNRIFKNGNKDYRINTQPEAIYQTTQTHNNNEGYSKES